MKIIVMGAGIVGVTTAYFLAKSGHQVIVLEKNQASSLGCSYANGGQLSYSHIEPWASPSALTLIAKSLFKPNSFLIINNFFDKDFLKWGYKFFKNCGKERFESNSQKIWQISKHSKESLAEILRNESGIKFNYTEGGILHFYQNARLFEKAIKEAQKHQSMGMKLHILNKEECLKKEPTLVKLYDENKLMGGIFYDDDASGNSLLFAKSLEKICQEKYGVVFEYDAEIKNIFTNYKKITGINTNRGVFTADNYVYALGAYGDRLLKGVNVDPKIYPLKGHSLSIEANEEFIAPAIALTDTENKIVYSRIGDIFRAAGAVEVAPLKPIKNNIQINFLRSKVKSSFSDFGNINKAQEWYGFRPFRPNSIPLIGQIEKYGNLYINTGHGHLGWTLSCGSANILSRIINGQKNSAFDFLKEEFSE